MPKLRISRRVQEHMHGTGIGQQPHLGYTGGKDPVQDDAGRSLITKLSTRSARKDGALTVDLDATEAKILYAYVDVLVIGARDNLGWGDEGRDALADLNAAQACLRSLENTFGQAVSL